jgi:hypothetical protein
MSYREALFLAARRYWQAQLRAHGGNLTRAARASRVDRTAAYRILQMLGLSPSAFRHGKRGWSRLTPSAAQAYSIFLGRRHRPHVSNFFPVRGRVRSR